MKFRTEIDIEQFFEKIDYSSRIFTIGSCFAQRIGGAMSRAKFQSTVNPTGTLFNPMSVCSSIERLSTKRFIREDELREGDLGWYHFDFHSSLSAPTKLQTLQQINHAIERGYEAIQSADWVVITLGTSWIYRLIESGELVANCHKLPARNFRRERLSVEEVVSTIGKTVDNHLKDKNIILTVSPIRHIADGLSENSLSKATLRLAIDQLVHTYNNIVYFPSYEILIDDLRDYRFYAQDMVHPSDVAVEYIWDLFSEAALSSQAKELMPRVMKIIKAREHRPTNPESDAHKSLCRAQLRAIDQLSQVDMSEEKLYFQSVLGEQLLLMR
ncbi:MAG: GSCFA domain-containing protein [Rikenellaceae bacterium]